MMSTRPLLIAGLIVLTCLSLESTARPTFAADPSTVPAVKATSPTADGDAAAAAKTEATPTTEAPAKPAPAVWSPDAAYVTRLDPAITLNGYEIRGPIGWEVSGLGGPGKIGRAWTGSPLADGGRPYFNFWLLGLPGAQEDKRTPEDFLTLRMHNVSIRKGDFNMGPIELGTIHGILFARCHWTGIDLVSKKKTEGFMYSGRDASQVIDLRAENEAGDPLKCLALSEAAAFTFQKSLAHILDDVQKTPSAPPMPHL